MIHTIKTPIQNRKPKEQSTHSQIKHILYLRTNMAFSDANFQTADHHHWNFPCLLRSDEPSRFVVSILASLESSWARLGRSRWTGKLWRLCCSWRSSCTVLGLTSSKVPPSPMPRTGIPSVSVIRLKLIYKQNFLSWDFCPVWVSVLLAR